MKKLMLVLTCAFSLSAFAKEAVKDEAKIQKNRTPSGEATYEWKDTFTCSVSQVVADKSATGNPKYNIKSVGTTEVKVRKVPDGANYKNLKTANAVITVTNELSVRLQIDLSQHQEHLVSITGKSDLLQVYAALIYSKSGKQRVVVREQSRAFGDSADGGSFAVDINLVNPDVLSIALQKKQSIFPMAGDGFDIAPISNLIANGAIVDKSLISLQVKCSTFSTKPGGGWGF